MKRKSTNRIATIVLCALLLIQQYIYCGRRLLASEIESRIENMALSTSLSNAASLHRILVHLRQDDIEKVMSSLEAHIDLALLNAEPYLDADPQFRIAYVATDWMKLKKDRVDYPRERGRVERNAIVDSILDRLIEMDL